MQSGEKTTPKTKLLCFILGETRHLIQFNLEHRFPPPPFFFFFWGKKTPLLFFTSG